METFNSNVKPWLWQTIGVLLALFLVLVVIDKFYQVTQDFRPTTPKNTISMSAQGKTSATPDLATINVGVTSTGSTAKGVQDEMTKKVNSVTEFVKQQGIDPKDITTSGYYVNQTYDYSINKPNGYQGSANITIKIRGVDKSTEKVSTILDGATTNGSNQIQGVSFSFDDPDNLKQVARKQAIEKAKQKAQELADATGLRLGRVVSVSDSSSYYPTPVPYAMDAAKAVSNESRMVPAIEAGSQDITADVTVVFEVK